MRLVLKEKIGLALIFGLTIWILILQFLFLAELVDPGIDFAYSTVITYIGITYLTAMYIAVATLIWIEIKDLEEFHIDKFTVVTFILGSFLQQRLEVVGGAYFFGIERSNRHLTTYCSGFKKAKDFKSKFPLGFGWHTTWWSRYYRDYLPRIAFETNVDTCSACSK